MNRFVRCILFALVSAAPVAAWGQTFTPNDPKYATREQYMNVIGMPSAWNVSQGSPSVVVAVLDTGVDTNLPDLNGRILPALSTTGTSPFSNTTMETTTNSSGTHILLHGAWVASSVAMEINNNVGGAGVGNFSILPITVTNSAANNNSQWIADGIRLAADQGARVINISSSTLDYNLLDSAAAYARSKGALTFIAAGNSNARNTAIPDLSNLIFVTGTDNNDNRWVESDNSAGSTWGPFVDLAAPSSQILVEDPTISTGYGLIDGTSFASPLAAGVAALAWSINPNLTPDQVENMLFSTAVHTGTLSDSDMFGNGRIDAGAVASLALASVPEPTTLALGLVGGLLVIRQARKAKAKRRARAV